MEYKNTDEKLQTVKSSPDVVSHLVPNKEDCRNCENKSCQYVCPAGVYEWTDWDNRMLVKFENCLECGACRVACDKQSIVWKYPRAGYGITYKQG